MVPERYVYPFRMTRSEFDSLRTAFVYLQATAGMLACHPAGELRLLVDEVHQIFLCGWEPIMAAVQGLEARAQSGDAIETDPVAKVTQGEFDLLNASRLRLNATACLVAECVGDRLPITRDELVQLITVGLQPLLAALEAIEARALADAAPQGAAAVRAEAQEGVR